MNKEFGADGSNIISRFPPAPLPSIPSPLHLYSVDMMGSGSFHLR